MSESRVRVLRRKLKEHRGRLISSFVSAGLGGWLDRCTRFVDWVSRVDTVNLHRHEIPQFLAVFVARVGPWTPELCYAASVGFVVWWLSGREAKDALPATSASPESRQPVGIPPRVEFPDAAMEAHTRELKRANDIAEQARIDAKVRELRARVTSPADPYRDYKEAALGWSKPQPNIIPTLPRSVQGYIDKHGLPRLGVDQSQTHLPFDKRRNVGHLILAPFKNEPDSAHPNVRVTYALGASVKVKKIDDFPVTGYWLDSQKRTLELGVGTPEQSIVIAFVTPTYAQLVRDQREGIERAIDYQTFWTGPSSSIPETVLVVKLMDGGRLLGEHEYLLRFSGPVVYLLTPSEQHT